MIDKASELTDRVIKTLPEAVKEWGAVGNLGVDRVREMSNDSRRELLRSNTDLVTATVEAVLLVNKGEFVLSKELVVDVPKSRFEETLLAPHFPDGCRVQYLSLSSSRQEVGRGIFLMSTSNDRRVAQSVEVSFKVGNEGVKVEDMSINTTGPFIAAQIPTQLAIFSEEILKTEEDSLKIQS